MMFSFRSLLLSATALVTGTTGIAQVSRVDPAEKTSPEIAASRYIVLFANRSFDLEDFRRAIYRRAPDREVQRIVRRMEAAVIRDQAGFKERLAQLGGRIDRQWWIVNGCSIEIPARQIAAVRALPNVARVDTDHIRRPMLADATNVAHHASDQANTMKDAKGAFITGKGVSVAVLDTGADAISGTTGRPHAGHFPGGNPANNKNGGIKGSLLMAALRSPQVSETEDATGHGTAVIGCVAANKWNALAGVDNAIAPGAGIVSVNIANKAGISVDAWIVSAWQMVAKDRAKYSIGVANNSFTGSPSLSNAAQLALDSAARNADLLVCVSAGNVPTSTKDSQHAYNGLAVGSVDKTNLGKSSFSAIGPLHLTKRTYPDIAAVGAGMTTMLRENEKGRSVQSGTSYAAPLVAGTAALVRQAQPTLTASEVRAILLNTTKFVKTTRNEYGAGFMKSDAAVTAALNLDAVSGAVAHNRTTANFDFKTKNAGMKTVTIAWMREAILAAPPVLDLRIFDGNNTLVAHDTHTENSFEQVRFTAGAGADYRAQVTWMNAPARPKSIEFAIAGVTDLGAPRLVRMQPAAVTSYQPGVVDIVGDALATATSVTIGGKTTKFTVMDDTTIRVATPALLPIGVATVIVKTASGTSNPIVLKVTGRSKPVLVGKPIAFRTTQPYTYEIYSGKSWRTLLIASLSSKPSKLTGIYDLGIGDNFSSLVPLIYLNQDASGASQVKFTYPSFVPPGTSIFYQALSTDPSAPKMPFPASNVLWVRVY